MVKRPEILCGIFEGTKTTRRYALASFCLDSLLRELNALQKLFETGQVPSLAQVIQCFELLPTSDMHPCPSPLPRSRRTTHCSLLLHLKLLRPRPRLPSQIRPRSDLDLLTRRRHLRFTLHGRTPHVRLCL